MHLSVQISFPSRLVHFVHSAKSSLTIEPGCCRAAEEVKEEAKAKENGRAPVDVEKACPMDVLPI